LVKGSVVSVLLPASVAKLKMNAAESFEICFIVFSPLIVKVRLAILCCCALLAGEFDAAVAGAALERVIGVRRSGGGAEPGSEEARKPREG
jgi:hypothetical protein